MINGKCISRCVSLAAELGISDLLADGPKDASALARATETNPDALYRVLRMLAACGVFDELPEKRFQNTLLSEALRGGSSQSVRGFARWFGRELHWQIWSDLGYSVRTGEPAIHTTHPDRLPFEVLAEHPGDQAAFNEAMSALSAADGAAIVQSYDFSPFGRIVDVGGGDGTLASLIAAAAPHTTVTVFDLPHVIQGSVACASRPSSAGRVNAVPGSIFDGIPGPADLCVLKHILHDWQDKDAVRILRNCRDVLNPGGRVLVCEMLIAPGESGVAASILDIEMLVGAGGRERTEREFSELLAAAGLRLERVIATGSTLELLEAASG